MKCKVSDFFRLTLCIAVVGITDVGIAGVGITGVGITGVGITGVGIAVPDLTGWMRKRKGKEEGQG